MGFYIRIQAHTTTVYKIVAVQNWTVDGALKLSHSRAFFGKYSLPVHRSPPFLSLFGPPAAIHCMRCPHIIQRTKNEQVWLLCVCTVNFALRIPREKSHIHQKLPAFLYLPLFLVLTSVSSFRCIEWQTAICSRAHTQGISHNHIWHFGCRHSLGTSNWKYNTRNYPYSYRHIERERVELYTNIAQARCILHHNSNGNVAKIYNVQAIRKHEKISF